MDSYLRPRKRLSWIWQPAASAFAVAILAGGVARAGELPSPLKPEAGA